MTIKELRKSNNLSQKEFGRIIGVTQAVNKWEHNDVKLSQENQDKIDKIFGLKRAMTRATSQDLGI